jgi:hypothetical protein
LRDDDLVTVDRYLFRAEAELARARLEASGIDAVLADENVVRMGEAQAHGGVRLQVRRRDAEEAREVLDEEGDDAPLEEDLETTPDVERCRRCFSQEIYQATNRVRVFSTTLLAFFFLPFALGAIGMFVRIPREVVIGAAVSVFVAPFVAALVLSVIARKRCRNCGLEWR